MSVIEDTRQAEALKLYVDQDPDGQVDSTTLLRWCISPEMRAELLEKDVEDPQLLIVISNNLEEIDRYLVPLLAEFAYIQFRRPGENIVHAHIVYKWRNDLKKVLFKKGRTPSSVEVLTVVQKEVQALQADFSTLYERIESVGDDLDAEQDKARALEAEDEADLDDEGGLSEDDLARRSIDRQIKQLERDRANIGRTPEEIAAELADDQPDYDLIAKLEAELVVLNAQAEELHVALGTARETAPKEAVIDTKLFEKEWHHDDKLNGLGSEAQLGVHVPPEMFAHEPNAIIRWLATRHDWPTKPRDECDMRRRALHAISVLPLKWIALLIPLIIIEVIDLVLIALQLFFGMRGIRFDALRHPFTVWPKRVWYDCKRSVYVWKRHKLTEPNGYGEYVEYSERSWIFYLLNLPAITALTGLGVFLWLRYDLPVLKILAGILFLVIVILLLIRPVSWLYEQHTKMSTAKYQREQKLAREAYARDLELLSCDLRPRAANYQAVPKERRSVTLRFAHLKTLVCRPFAQ